MTGSRAVGSKGVFPAGGGVGMLTVRRMQQAVQSKARQTESGKCKLGEKQQTTTTRKKNVKEANIKQKTQVS